MLKREESVLICFLCVFLLSACGIGANSMIDSRLNQLNNNPYEDIPEQRVEAIIDAAQNNDSSSIYDLFSNTAKNKGISDESISAFISFFDGKVDVQERSGSNGQQKNHYGEKTESYDSYFYIIHNDLKYILSFGECVRDDTDADNVGVMWIVVFPDGEAFPEDAGDYGVYVFA